MKARRGDAVLIVRNTHVYIIGQQLRQRAECTFALVTNITQGGNVKKVRRIAYGTDVLESAASDLQPRESVLIIPSVAVDVAGLLAAAKAHHYAGHPNQPKPFDSIEEARDFARPFRKEAAA